MNRKEFTNALVRAKFAADFRKASASYDDLELARICKVGTGTIRRWKSGVSSPHPLSQKSLFNLLDR
jgi:DNA-binding transcriptional regulator YiaG